jgi:hypothetical protein
LQTAAPSTHFLSALQWDAKTIICKKEVFDDLLKTIFSYMPHRPKAKPKRQLQFDF